MNILHPSFLYCALIIFFPLPTRENPTPFQEKTSGPISNAVMPNEIGPVATNIIYRSKDNGKTWQDISNGLPENMEPQDFFASESDIYMRSEESIYRSKSNLQSPVWKNESDLDPQMRSVAFNPSAVRARNVVELRGVLVATGQKGIRRSTDNGETWEWVISEGGVGIAIEKIEGGIAAISYNTKMKSRRIHVSFDEGETWEDIGNGLRPSMFISSIKQVANYLICGHPDGIFRSSDMGKTWNMVHPSVENRDVEYRSTLNSDNEDPGKVFKIYVSGNTVYAVAGSAGC